MFSKAIGATRSPSSATGEVVKAVTSRRVLTYFSLFAVALALAVLTPGAGAVNKCEELLGTATFTDPVGDGSDTNAPDITAVTVSSYEGGGTKFEVALADPSEPVTVADRFKPVTHSAKPNVVKDEPETGTDLFTRIFVDSDKNASTGDEKGFEYMIQTQKAGQGDYVSESVECDDESVTTLFKWSGSGWDPVETDSLGSWYNDGNLVVQIDASELGDALNFNLAVYAASNVTYDDAGAPQLENASFDWAPDTGTYSYQPVESSTYTDPVGDGTGTDAPDITKVVITKWKGDLVKLSVEIPETVEFGDDMLVRIYIDSDSNSATGNAKGFDYLIQAQRASFDWWETDGLTLAPRALSGARGVKCYQPELMLLAWDGSRWVASEDQSVDWRYGKGLKVAIDSADLGDAKTFNFAVYAASNVKFDDAGNPDLADASFDWAPDTGTFAFPLAVENAPLEGAYKVVYKVTSSRNFGNLKRGSVSARTWKFVRSCKKNKCATNVVTGGKVAFKLSRAGKSYKAKAGRKFDCQAGFSARGSESYQLKVQKSRWIKGTWRAAKWAGTVRVVSPDNHVSACGGAASYTASLTGTLK